MRWNLGRRVSESEAIQETGPGSMSIVLALLAFSVFINYIDRANLSIAAPMLKDELGMSASQLGLLLSSFFWTYSLFLILSGWLVDRLNVSWVLAIGFLLWSAATSATGFSHGFTALLVVRLALGIGESVAYPAYSRILTKYFPASQRASANSIIASGLACGPAFGMLLGGMLMSRFGWRSFFVVLGSVTLVWLLPWFRWMPRGPGIAPQMQLGPEPTTREILKQRSAWGTFLGLFSSTYSLYFLTAWLPFYLVRERHFSMDAMGRIGGAVFLTQALSSTVCGRIGDRWIAAGGTRTRVHMTFMIAGLVGTSGFLVASSLVGNALSVGLLLLVGASVGSTLASVWPITQTLAGPRASGRWTGLQCAFGNTSGALASAVTGFILDRTGHFFWAFAVAAAFCITGVLSWLLLVCPVEPVIWARRAPVEFREAEGELARVSETSSGIHRRLAKRKGNRTQHPIGRVVFAGGLPSEEYAKGMEPNCDGAVSFSSKPGESLHSPIEA
jgi:MFS transporter, ACS family, D-galactonate transporter